MGILSQVTGSFQERLWKADLSQALETAETKEDPATSRRVLDATHPRPRTPVRDHMLFFLSPGASLGMGYAHGGKLAEEIEIFKV